MSSTSKIYSYLLDIQNKCFEFSKLHSDDAKKLSLRNTILNITNIVITSGVATLTTSFNAINNNTQESNSERVITVSIVSAVLLYFSAVINSVQQFLNLEKLAEKNKITALRYIKLGNNIKRFLAVEELQNQDIIEYFKWVSSTYEEIISATAHHESNIELTPQPIEQPFSINETSNILDINFEPENNEYNSEIENIPTMKHPKTNSLKYEMDRWGVDSMKK